MIQENFGTPNKECLTNEEIKERDKQMWEMWMRVRSQQKINLSTPLIYEENLGRTDSYFPCNCNEKLTECHGNCKSRYKL